MSTSVPLARFYNMNLVPLPPDPDLLDRYLAGECSAAERRELEHWLAAHPEVAASIATLREGFQARRAQLSFPQGEDAVARVAAAVAQGDRMAAPGVSGRMGRSSHGFRPRRWMGWGVAGAIVALLLILFVPARHSSSPNIVQYRTQPGERAQLVLRDGSQVVLAPQTEFAVTYDASRDGAHISMTGEALFTVTSSHRAPFIVRTHTASATVLGTQFAIRGYAADTGTRVVVTEGRVNVAAHTADGTTQATAILAANQVATIADSGTIAITPTVTAIDYTAWSTGTLIFRETPIAQVVVELSRAYGVDIRVVDSVVARTALTWRVPVTQRTLGSVLDFLSVTLNARVRRNNNVILLEPGSPKPAERKIEHPHNSFTPERGYGK